MFYTPVDALEFFSSSWSTNRDSELHPVSNPLCCVSSFSRSLSPPPLYVFLGSFLCSSQLYTTVVLTRLEKTVYGLARWPFVLFFHHPVIARSAAHCNLMHWLPEWSYWSINVTTFFFFYVALWPNAGHGLLILDVSRSHTTTHHSR